MFLIHSESPGVRGEEVPESNAVLGGNSASDIGGLNILLKLVSRLRSVVKSGLLIDGGVVIDEDICDWFGWTCLWRVDLVPFR